MGGERGLFPNEWKLLLDESLLIIPASRTNAQTRKTLTEENEKHVQHLQEKETRIAEVEKLMDKRVEGLENHLDKLKQKHEDLSGWRNCFF